MRIALPAVVSLLGATLLYLPMATAGEPMEILEPTDERLGNEFLAPRGNSLGDILAVDSDGSPTGSDGSPAGKLAFAEGQEALLGEILGVGESLPGECRFSGGAIEPMLARGTYSCREGELVVELRHVRDPSPSVAHSAKLSIHLMGNHPPQGFLEAMVHRAREREDRIRWIVTLPEIKTSWLQGFRDSLLAKLASLFAKLAASKSLLVIDLVAAALFLWASRRRRVPE